jgi:transcriptional regulator with XRE-family HTH domain
MASPRLHIDIISTIRDKLRQAAHSSGLTLEEIGLRMGFAKGGARQAVSRLLNQEPGHDPRLSTLLAFAKALNRSLKDLL